MAKKRSRRSRKSYSVSTQSPPAAAEPDLEQEYRYVLVDLRSMGLLAVAMFALLVVLALLLG